MVNDQAGYEDQSIAGASEGADQDDFDMEFDGEFDKLLEDEETWQEEQSKVDLDIDEEFRDADNEGLVQAHQYDRAFVTSGAIVRVYENKVEEGHGSILANRLKYDSHLPLIKDKTGMTIEPTNLMLHNGESNLLFVDKFDQRRMFNFDLEHGKIVAEFETHKNGVDMICSQAKNGQTTAE